jgi:hypothetical protein
MSSDGVVPSPGPRPSIRQICRLIGCDPSTYSKYARIGLLKQDSRDGCDERTAVELAVLWRLVRELKPEQGHVAWRKIHRDVLRVWDSESFDVVWEPNSRRATLVSDPVIGFEVARKAGLVHVVSCASEVAAIRAAWKDAARAAVTRVGVVATVAGRSG